MKRKNEQEIESALNQPQQGLFELAYAALQKGADEINHIYTLQWNVRADIAKTILTISSAIIVIGIAFGPSLIKSRFKWVLTISWCAFLLSILSAILTLWLSLGLYTFSAFLVNSRKELRGLVRTADLNNLDAEQLVLPIIGDRLDFMERLDRRAMTVLKISLIAFVIAILGLAAIGWKQFTS